MFGLRKKQTLDRLSKRPPMSDTEFVAALELADEHHQLATAIRQTLARLCRTDPEKLYPTDDTEMLSDHMPADFFLEEPDFDDLKFLMALEDLTGLELDYPENLPRFHSGRFFWIKYPKSENLGVWITDAIGVIRRAMASQP